MKSNRWELPALDGLRALAILLVICCHMVIWDLPLQGNHAGWVRTLGAFGFAGVFLFFVLSGFLLFLPYARALIGDAQWPSARRFYERRALRILPVYLVVLFLLLYFYVYIGRTPVTPQAVALTPLLLFNMLPASTTLVNRMNPPFWTLAVEWQFYLLLPWIALGLAKLVGRRSGRARAVRLAWGLAFLVASGLLLRCLAAIAHYSTGLDNPAAIPGLPGFLLSIFYGARGRGLDVFALGMGLSLFYVWGIEQGHLSMSRQYRVSVGALGLFAGAIIASVWWTTQVDRIPDVTTVYLPHGQVWAVFGEWSLGVCFGLLLLAVLCGTSWLTSFFSLQPLRYIGIISYSLYAWHWPLMQIWFKVVVPPTPENSGWSPVVIGGIVLLVGSASYYCVERPFLRWRRSARVLSGEIREKYAG
jgi:peptidoglycan/LPS O-acetylase OafA/YrhL